MSSWRARTRATSPSARAPAACGSRWRSSSTASGGRRRDGRVPRRDPRLPAVPLARAAAPLQVPPDLFGIRGAGHPVLWHPQRDGARRLAPAALQPVQPRRLRPRIRANPLPALPPHPALVHYLASNPLQPLIDVFESILKFFHDSVGLQWGWAIIALTVLVRAALLPLTFKQFHSMQRLAHLQPEMKKLQDRHKGDKERMNQEMMKFYRENKVNPFSSCLPMVAQFPVFISLYYMLRVDLRRDICPEINGPGSPHYASPIPCGSSGDSSFLFIPDLTDKATGGVLIALIILYVGSQLFSTLLMSTTTDRTQRMIFLALPFLFVTFVIRFPAGLLVYWITTNCWTIVQQLIIKKRLGPMRPALAEGEEPPPSPFSGLFGGGASAGDGGAPAKTPKSPKGPSAQSRSKEPAAVSTSNEPKGRPSTRPPAPPRKKKKRSGRRR